MAPAPVAAPPAPFTCVGQVASYDSILGVEMRCDGVGRTWHLAAGDGMDLPSVLRLDVRGSFEVRPLHEKTALLVAFTDTSGVRHTPQPDDDCFLTTAASRNRGLPDDCAALQVMRAFRDEVLGRDHPDVRAYEAFAPAVVAAVQARPDAGRVWDVLYEDYLEPILAQIAAGDDDAAHASYRRMVEDLARGLGVSAS